MSKYSPLQRRYLARLSDAVTAMFRLGHESTLVWVETLAEEALNGTEETTERAVQRAEAMVSDAKGAKAARAHLADMSLLEAEEVVERLYDLPEALFDDAHVLTGYRRTVRALVDAKRQEESVKAASEAAGSTLRATSQSA